MKKYFPMVILMLFGFQANHIIGQAVSSTSNQQVPLDQSITYGKLENGLAYYIKPVPESQEEVNLYFYIKAGSYHQDSDQLNMAHFVEHMAFKSTEHFPSGIHYELKTNKSLNLGQSAVNGSAGAHLTRYRFDVPAHNKEGLKTGLLWFKDIATGLHFKNEEIDTERGVLVQEFMFRTSSDSQETYAKFKLLAQMSPCMENYSNFVEHHETFDYERLKQFYKDWYRPDLMAIVIAGKIEDVDALEKQIANQFSDIPIKENPRELPNCETLFFNQLPRFVVVEKVSDSQLNDEKVEMELLFSDKKTPDIISRKEGVKRMNEIGLFIEIINNRLRETKKYGNLFDIRIQHTFKGSMVPSSFKVFLTSYNNSEKGTLQTFTRVLEQVKQYGVTEYEFVQAKKKRIDQLRKMDRGGSLYWHDEIKDHLIYGEALPSDKPGFIRSWLSNYEVSEFKEFIEGINFERPDIGIIAPTDHRALSYEEKEIRSWISEVSQGTIEPYVQPEAPINLMSSSEVRNLQELKYEDKGVRESGAREIILANGVKVFLKSFKPSPSPYQNKIMLHGFNNRGALDFPAEDYFSAINTPRIIKHSGVGEFDKFELRRHFSTNSLFMNGVNLYINNLEAGIKIDSDPTEVEKMLQLLYLLFSQPREDTLAFEDWKVQQSRHYKNQGKVEQHDIRYNIRKFIRDNSGVSRGTERHLGLEKTDMRKGFEIYKELFGDAQDFTFILTGDFPMDAILPLINKYLGNLPSFQSETIYTQNRDVFAPKPTGPVLTHFKFPDSYSQTNYIYNPTYIVPTNNQDNWKENLLVTALGRTLRSKAWAFRLEKGYALYDLSAYGKYNKNMKQHELSATFRCTPEEYPLFRQEFAEIVTELQSELVSHEVFKGIVREMQDFHESRMKEHRYIHDKLYSHLRFGEPWLDEIEFIQYIQSLTPEDILKAAQKYFKDEYLYEFVMMN